MCVCVGACVRACMHHVPNDILHVLYRYCDRMRLIIVPLTSYLTSITSRFMHISRIPYSKVIIINSMPRVIHPCVPTGTGSVVVHFVYVASSSWSSLGYIICKLMNVEKYLFINTIKLFLFFIKIVTMYRVPRYTWGSHYWIIIIFFFLANLAC